MIVCEHKQADTRVALPLLCAKCVETMQQISQRPSLGYSKLEARVEIVVITNMSFASSTWHVSIPSMLPFLVVTICISPYTISHAETSRCIPALGIAHPKAKTQNAQPAQCYRRERLSSLLVSLVLRSLDAALR